MFRLIATVRRGTASDLPPTSARYPTLDAARAGVAALLRDERVQRVMVVQNDLRQTFVEWGTR
jgi:hypothetical protein